MVLSSFIAVVLALSLTGCSNESQPSKSVDESTTQKQESTTQKESTTQEVSQSDTAIRYDMHSTSFDVTDSQGYSFRMTLNIGDWIEDIDCAKDVFANVMGSNAAFPSLASFSQVNVPNQSDFAYAIGKVTVQNQTENFHFSSSKTQNVGFEIKVKYLDSGFSGGIIQAVAYDKGKTKKWWSAFGGSSKFDILRENGSYTYLTMTSDGPTDIKFILAVDNRKTPNKPNGPQDLRQIAFSIDNSEYITADIM